MLNRLAGKTGHPMTDLREVRGLVAALPHQDPITALEDIAIWLESLPRRGASICKDSSMSSTRSSKPQRPAGAGSRRNI